DEDPNFALAYAGEAEVYITLVGPGLMPPREYIEKAQVAATKALALDDSLAEAHNALAASLFLQHHCQDAEREYKRAMKPNPNLAPAQRWWGLTLEALGQQSATPPQRKLAPHNFLSSSPISMAVCVPFFNPRENEKAIAGCKRTL